MKVSSIDTGINIIPKQTNFRSQNTVYAIQNGHDEFIATKKEAKNSKAWWITAGLVLTGIGAVWGHKAGWFKKSADKLINSNETFKNIDNAKKYFENLGVETEFRGVKDEHLPLLNRIKENIKQLQEMGVKKEKPDSITISDWNNKAELEELYRNKGVTLSEYKPGYFAQMLTSQNGKKHIFINSNHPNFDMFRHEMGHVNDGLYDSYWHVKGIQGHDFADKQLNTLGKNEKISRQTADFNNIFYFKPKEFDATFVFPLENGETRYAHVQNMLAKMQEETGCYAPKLLHEQKAYIFEGLLKGKNFSDEVMLYYDFSGGARIPNLKIKGKTYDEYIESLYNNSELIQKLRENVKISKI